MPRRTCVSFETSRSLVSRVWKRSARRISGSIVRSVARISIMVDRSACHRSCVPGQKMDQFTRSGSSKSAAVALRIRQTVLDLLPSRNGRDEI